MNKLITTLGVIVLFSGCIGVSEKDIAREQELQDSIREARLNPRNPADSPKTREQVLIDSLDSIYEVKGLNSFGNALRQDKMIYSAASYIAGLTYEDFNDKRQKLESSIVRVVSKAWRNKYNVNKEDFEKDILTDVMELKNEGHKNSRYDNAGFKSFLAGKGDVNPEDVIGYIDEFLTLNNL